MATIYHITTLHDWNEAQENGIYETKSLAKEGFIHCCEDHQVAGVVHRYFEITNDLVKLKINSDRVNCEVKYEFSPSVNEIFPHIYGLLNLSAVTEVIQL
jgi:uncharacterized protein (DUF952 family)